MSYPIISADSHITEARDTYTKYIDRKWLDKAPYIARHDTLGDVYRHDMKAVGASGMKGLMEIVMATHSGMTAAEFEREVSQWLATTKQSKFKRLYTEFGLSTSA